jgi:hypothetical protein
MGGRGDGDVELTPKLQPIGLLGGKPPTRWATARRLLVLGEDMTGLSRRPLKMQGFCTNE